MPNLPRGQQPQATVTYVDRPEISETFADSCARVVVEGLNVKMEFAVNRMEDPKPPAPPSGKALTVCRIVIPLPGLVDLHGKLSQILAALQAQGVITPLPPMPQMQNPSGKPN